MASTSLDSDALNDTSALDRPPLDAPANPLARLLFILVLIGGLGYAGLSIALETGRVGETLAMTTVVLLGTALLIALAFEFVNGFHDTANAVATVIYTNAMPAPVAIVWSGFFNFLGVMLSSGAVAFSIVTLLPVELILNVGNAAGFAMIFALLIAAVLWNLATWFVGLPNSSSHALIGSILGVGLANQLLSGGAGGTSGVNWAKAQEVLYGLAIAPVIGFGCALLLLLVMKQVLRNPKLYARPDRDAPPPPGIRGLLIFTCTAVSFFHGSNDGQKGMGLIMLILIGCAPTAYALNRGSDIPTPALVQQANATANIFKVHAAPATVPLGTARQVLASALKTKSANDPVVYAALDTVSRNVGAELTRYGSLAQVPAAATSGLRNDLYLALDTSKLVTKSKDAHARFSDAELKTVGDFQKGLENSTRFIPLWVKIAVAVALGMGTMVGWKRIVITVGEKIGKAHLTYGMGAAAELTAAGMILVADNYGLPVSTTHILSSGVAGASVASGAGLQLRTIRNMALAWFLTLPAVMALAAGLYWVGLTVIRAMGTA